MKSLGLTNLEFADKRRLEQDALIERLSGVIGAGFSTSDFTPLKKALENIYAEIWESETDEPLQHSVVRHFLIVVDKLLAKVDSESNVHTTALALANAVLNDATLQAAAKESGIEMEWVSMRDSKVRHTHEEADGQRQSIGDKFHVGEVEMIGPGDLSAPIEYWINCRCVLKPVPGTAMAAEIEHATHMGGDIFRQAVVQFGMKKALSLMAAADVTDTTLCIMAIPAGGQDLHGIGSEEKHATLLYFGDMNDSDDPERIKNDLGLIHQVVKIAASEVQPFTAKVSGIGPLGHDDTPAQVWLLESPELHSLFDSLLDIDSEVASMYADADTTKYPEYTPHVTIDYAEEAPEGADSVQQIAFDRLAVWHGSDRTEYPLGEPMPTAAVAEQTDAPEKDAPPLDDSDIQTPPDAEAPSEPVDDRIPWHGQLAPEGVKSGDGRMFTNLGRTRDLPLPLTWQEVSADGHDQNITVAMIEKVEMIDGVMEASGHFLSSEPKADKVIGLIAEFGKFGVSVDADDVGSASFDEQTEVEVYDDPRVCSACIVSIPAFATGAWVAIGPHPILDADQANGDVPDENDTPAEEKVPSAALVAALVPMASEGSLEIGEELFADAIERGIAVEVGLRDDGAVLYDLNPDAEVAAASHPLLKMAGVPEAYKKAVLDQYAGTILGQQEQAAQDDADAEAWAAIEAFKDLAPGVTEDGPGWLTHPVDTDRLRDYWVRGPGAAKIGWGVPGDFNRCRVNVAEYVKPQYLNGYCANRHYDALHVWPGQELSAAENLHLEDTKPAPAMTLVASAGWNAPSEWFTRPDVPEGEGIMFDSDDRHVFGYIAEWGVCHIGLDGECTEAPESSTNYALFTTGKVETPDGPVKVGTLTYDTGHANGRLPWRPAAAHYDNTGSAWAYVTTGEDERGIWFNGMVKPGLESDKLNEIKAAGRLSGDWRKWADSMELVAALTVNVGGFPIQPPALSYVAGGQVSLVAAGVVGQKEPEPSAPIEVSVLAMAVADEIEARARRRQTMATLKEKVDVG